MLTRHAIRDEVREEYRASGQNEEGSTEYSPGTCRCHDALPVITASINASQISRALLFEILTTGFFSVSGILTTTHIEPSPKLHLNYNCFAVTKRKKKQKTSPTLSSRFENHNFLRNRDDTLASQSQILYYVAHVFVKSKAEESREALFIYSTFSVLRGERPF